jgi:hypothetical protein
MPVIDMHTDRSKYGGESKMRQTLRWIGLTSIVAALSLAGCTPVSTDYEREHEPAEVEPIEGTDLSRVILEAEAAERLGIQTAPVRPIEGSETQLVIPYSAVLYDAHGDTWAYTSPAPLTYARDSISVDHIEGEEAVLSQGPASGTEVVTVGVAELFGAETGVGH